MANTDINLILKKISKIYDILSDIKNILIEEYTNVYSIDTINQLLSEAYGLIIFIYKDIYLLNNSKNLVDYLQIIRININKINYIIRYILIFQYQKINTNVDEINYNIFDDQFLLSKEFFNYVSNDSSEIQDLKKKLINYSVMNDKFNITFTVLNPDSLNENLDIYCGIKYALQIFISNEVVISKFVTKLKSTKKNNNLFESYLTKKRKIFSTIESSSTSSTSKSSTNSSTSSTSKSSTNSSTSSTSKSSTNSSTSSTSKSSTNSSTSSRPNSSSTSSRPNSSSTSSSIKKFNIFKNNIKNDSNQNLNISSNISLDKLFESTKKSSLIYKIFSKKNNTDESIKNKKTDINIKISRRILFKYFSKIDISHILIFITIASIAIIKYFPNYITKYNFDFIK